ncbi:hypothetical protein Bca101_080349 [Brassica carinata]
MARRYSIREKEKWVTDPARPTKRPPIVLPEIDCARRIEEHKFTLIGRVTNPIKQNTRALVDFFLQQWHVRGSFTGKSLGPLLFQFTFESEQDLQTILSKAPYHFKRWMLLLQRWEPIVSDHFPASIPFWVTIHGIPLHYWSEDSLRAIGKELGPVETTDEANGRVRVIVNGLKPLEKFLEISLKSGETKRVELEYENLEKHCFSCFSLSYEAGSCPIKPSSTDSPSTYLGVTQMRTLDRIAEGRRRADNRKFSRFSPYERRTEDTRTGRPDHHPRENPPQRVKDDSRLPYTESLPPVRESSSVSLRTRGTRVANPITKTVWRPVSDNGDGNGRQSQSIQSQVSHTPSPKPQREQISTNRGPLNSPNTPGITIAPSGDRRSALQRLSGDRRPALERISGSTQRTPPAQTATVSLSGERRHVLERLSGEPNRVPLLLNGAANSDSGRLQEVNIQYLEDVLPFPTPPDLMRPSNSKATAAGTSHPMDMQEGSPLRSLSEDRAHVSLRLGNMPALPTPESPLPALSKAAGKQKMTRATPKGGSQKPAGMGAVPKRRVTAKGSPKRNVTAPKSTKARGKATSTTGNQPPTTLIPATSKKRTGFRTAPPSLP